MSSDKSHLALNDWDRNVFCILGLPFDAENMLSALEKIRQSVTKKRKVFLTTPNLNFVVGSLQDKALRESVVKSNMVVVDGMPLVLVARLLGLPITERVAGASLFEMMFQYDPNKLKVNVYFFGGMEGVGEKAHQEANGGLNGVESVGYLYPGFKSVEEMSDPSYIQTINQANPDFLIVALGAQKGQLWIDRNFHLLTAPIVSHLGAVINFTAGNVMRAPTILQRLGLEWLWRIKEEPMLWKRYFKDGASFIKLLCFNVTPMAVYRWLNRLDYHLDCAGKVHVDDGTEDKLVLILSGDFQGRLSSNHRWIFKNAVETKKNVEVDFSRVHHVGPCLLGLLQIMRQKLEQQSNQLYLTKLGVKHKRIFRWCCVSYLLS